MSEQKDKGAHFFRCDFQVHTPRDSGWKGKRPTTPEDRRTYAEKFVEACRAKNLNAVAITDHHDFSFFPHIKAAAAAETAESGEPIPANNGWSYFPDLN